MQEMQTWVAASFQSEELKRTWIASGRESKGMYTSYNSIASCSINAHLYCIGMQLLKLFTGQIEIIPI